MGDQVDSSHSGSWSKYRWITDGNVFGGEKLPFNVETLLCACVVSCISTSVWAGSSSVKYADGIEGRRTREEVERRSSRPPRNTLTHIKGLAY